MCRSIQGTLMNKPEKVEADTLKAIEEARRAAAEFDAKD